LRVGHLKEIDLRHRTRDVEERARRMAVAWPMPWLAPVTMATDFDM